MVRGADTMIPESCVGGVRPCGGRWRAGSRAQQRWFALEKWNGDAVCGLRRRADPHFRFKESPGARAFDARRVLAVLVLDYRIRPRNLASTSSKLPRLGVPGMCATKNLPRLRYTLSSIAEEPKQLGFFLARV